MSGGRNKNHRQELAVAALLNSVTLDDAASKVGVTRRTLDRWLAEDDEFLSSYRAARRRVVEASISRLQDATSEAVDCLKRNLSCGTASTEVRAALGILDHSIRAIELYDIESRLQDLERRGS